MRAKIDKMIAKAASGSRTRALVRRLRDDGTDLPVIPERLREQPAQGSTCRRAACIGKPS